MRNKKQKVFILREHSSSPSPCCSSFLFVFLLSFISKGKKSITLMFVLNSFNFLCLILLVFLVCLFLNTPCFFSNVYLNIISNTTFSHPSIPPLVICQYHLQSSVNTTFSHPSIPPLVIRQYHLKSSANTTFSHPPIPPLVIRQFHLKSSANTTFSHPPIPP